MTNPELELAKDQLWKFQLRREHAQLLKNLDMHKDAFTAFAEEAKANQDSLMEQLTSLKSRFEKLAGDNERQAHEAKAQQRAVQEQIVDISKIKNDLIAFGVHSSVLKGGEKVAEDGTGVHIATPPAKSSSATFIRPSPVESSNPTTAPTQGASNAANRKSRRQARQEPSPQKPPTYSKLPYPPLNQDDRSLADYFSAMDKLSAGLDPAFSTGLAAMLVTGLAQREHQDKVVARLEEKGLARVLDGGQVEMLCKWGDLKPVLRAVGLLVAVSHKKKVR